MRYFFVLFDVSMEISPRQFHLGEIGHTLPKCYISVGKSHYPKGKMTRSVTAPIVRVGKKKKDY